MPDLKTLQSLQNVSTTRLEGDSSFTKMTIMRRAAAVALVLGASMSYLVLSKGCGFRGMVRTNSVHVEGIKDLSSLGLVGTVKWYECEGEGILPGAECGHIMYVPLSFVRAASITQANTEFLLTTLTRAQGSLKSRLEDTMPLALRGKASSC